MRPAPQTATLSPTLALWLTAGAGAFVASSQIALALTAPGFTHASATSVAAVLPLILLIAAPSAVALAAAPCLLRLSDQERALIAVIAVGCLIRLVWFFAPPMIEDDFYRYLWDGAVLAHGYNPYTHSPADVLAGNAPETLKSLAAESGQIISLINFPALRSIYPGTAEALFAVAHWFAPWDVNGLRTLFFGAELATLYLLVLVLRKLGLSPLCAALYWCNPFPAIMLVGQAHMDALLPPLVLGAVLMSYRGRYAVAGALLALAAGVKLWPVLLAPLLFRPILFNFRRLILAGAAMGAVLLLVAGPLLLSSLGAQSGLTAYAAGWANNNAPYAWTLWALKAVFGDGAGIEKALRLALALLGGCVALAVALRPARSLRELIQRALIVAAVVFYLSPAQFPWYAAWFLPLAVLALNWPLLAASALLPAYYLFFPLWQTGRGDLFMFGAAFIHSAPVFVWLALRATTPADMTVSPVSARS
jgi:hypothetical protein